MALFFKVSLFYFLKKCLEKYEIEALENVKPEDTIVTYLEINGTVRGKVVFLNNSVGQVTVTLP